MDEWNSKFFVNDKQNPYKTEPGKPFLWIRGRQVGGRSIIWGRQSYRWSDLDFEANQREGMGVDWPIRYKEIAPWYDYVEDFIGVSGQREGLPQLPDGHFLPGMELNCAEVVVKDAIAKYFPGRASHDHRAHRDPDSASQGTRALPLLRAVRSRLHHPLLLQQPELDFARCADHRQSDGASAQRGAQPDIRFEERKITGVRAIEGQMRDTVEFQPALSSCAPLRWSRPVSCSPPPLHNLPMGSPIPAESWGTT